MAMPYAFSCKSRSNFLPPIIKAIKQQRQDLISGRQIAIQLESEEGYNGEYECRINSKTSLVTADFNYKDETRFPARIRAATIALCIEGFNGTFEMSHYSGLVTIKLKD
jgi:hypothetical protein